MTLFSWFPARLALPMIVLSTILLSAGCKKNQDGVFDENIKTLFSYEFNGNNSTDIAEAFIYDDSIIVMSTEELSFYFDGLGLQKRNLNQSTYSEAIVSGTYSSNVKKETSGFIQIEEWDERNIQISGSFEFDAYDSFDTSNIVTVRNGRFEEISVFRTNRNFYKGKARANFRDKNIAYRLVNSRYNASDTTIRIQFSHPSKNDFTVTFDANLSAGNYLITDLNPEQFLVEFEDRLVKQKLIPENNCTLNISKIDIDNQHIMLNFSGEFSDEFAAPFTVENIAITTFSF